MKHGSGKKKLWSEVLSDHVYFVLLQSFCRKQIPHCVSDETGKNTERIEENEEQEFDG